MLHATAIESGAAGRGRFPRSCFRVGAAGGSNGCPPASRRSTASCANEGPGGSKVTAAEPFAAIRRLVGSAAAWRARSASGQRARSSSGAALLAPGRSPRARRPGGRGPRQRRISNEFGKFWLVRSNASRQAPAAGRLEARRVGWMPRRAAIGAMTAGRVTSKVRLGERVLGGLRNERIQRLRGLASHAQYPAGSKGPAARRERVELARREASRPRAGGPGEKDPQNTWSPARGGGLLAWAAGAGSRARGLGARGSGLGAERKERQREGSQPKGRGQRRKWLKKAPQEAPKNRLRQTLAPRNQLRETSSDKPALTSQL